MGFLILSACTSLPECFSVIYSLYSHYTSVPLPLVTGSNVFNFTLLIGLVTLRYPVKISGFHREEDVWAQILFGLILFLNFLYTSKIHISTFFIVFILFIFFGYLVRKSVLRNRNEKQLPESSYIKTSPFFSLVYGVIMTISGSILLVESGQAISTFLGGREVFVNALLIGGVTSIPEFLLTVYLLKKNFSSVAVSNLMGSGVFNWVIVFAFPMFIFGNFYDTMLSYKCIFGAYFFTLVSTYFYITTKKKIAMRKYDSLIFIALYLLFGLWMYFC